MGREEKGGEKEGDGKGSTISEKRSPSIRWLVTGLKLHILCFQFNLVICHGILPQNRW